MPGLDIRGVIEPLDYRELEAFRRRAEWCHSDKRRSEQDLREYLTRATASAKESGLTDKEIIEFFRTEIIERGPYETPTRIKRALTDLQIAGSIRQVRRQEEFACAQLFGGLQEKFQGPYTVRHEKQMENNHRLDLYIRDERDESEYTVEAKISDNINNPTRSVREKVISYQEALSNHARSFVLVFFSTISTTASPRMGLSRTSITSGRKTGSKSSNRSRTVRSSHASFPKTGATRREILHQRRHALYTQRGLNSESGTPTTYTQNEWPALDLFGSGETLNR